MQQTDAGHHIVSRFDEELERLRSGVLEMGGLVEAQLQNALRALADADSSRAQDVLRAEYRVNAMEVALDDDCNRVLATRAPAASDLRLVVAVLKAITDLERIGDEARKIGSIGLRHSSMDIAADGYRTIRNLGRASLQLLHDALEVFARLDAKAALEVLRTDRLVDQEHEAVQRQCITCMMEDPRRIRATIDLLWIARALERVGDHSKNLCEYVIYAVVGHDVRHAALGEVEQRLAEHEQAAPAAPRG
jgi:phosphate transport system protein